VDELARVLAPGAALVVVWLFNEGDEGPWTHEVRALLEPLWKRSSHPSIVQGRRAEALEDHPAFTPMHRSELAFEDRLDRDAALAWFASFSVVGALPDDERADTLVRIAEILDRPGAGDGITRRWRADVRATTRR
jgi:hypothetical protein